MPTTFHYFELYGRGEPIRMLLWKAGVEFVNEVYPMPNFPYLKGDKFDALIESGKCPQKRLPMLEQEDGTIISQAPAVLRYLGAKHGFAIGQDPMD